MRGLPLQALYEKTGGDASLGGLLPWGDTAGYGGPRLQQHCLDFELAPPAGQSAIGDHLHLSACAGTSLETLWDAHKGGLLAEAGVGDPQAAAKARKLFDWHIANLEVGGLRPWLLLPASCVDQQGVQAA